MDISIVILHHGSPREVAANLEALKNAWLPEKRRFGWLITEKSAPKIPFDDGDVRCASGCFELRYFEIENRGYPQGNNFGFVLAKGEFLCI